MRWRARALLQSVPDSYVNATVANPTGPIDVARARAQHAAMVSGLKWLGFETTVLTGPAGPDAVFVEDPAVIHGGRVLMTRSAHSVRAEEGGRLRAPLAEMGLEVVSQQGGTLDGGDVLILGDEAFVGLTARTDVRGAAALEEAFPQLHVQTVALPAGVLHLKCDCSPLGPGRVLCTAALVPTFADFETVVVPAGEEYAANCIAMGSRALVSAGFPGTAQRLEAAGFDLRVLEMDAFRAGDGSMTCLSLRTGA